MTLVIDALTYFDAATAGPDGAALPPEGMELSAEAELFAQLASQATEALLLSHRAVLIAEAKLAARAGAASSAAPSGAAMAANRAETEQSAVVIVTRPRQRLRERFGLQV